MSKGFSKAEVRQSAYTKMLVPTNSKKLDRLINNRKMKAVEIHGNCSEGFVASIIFQCGSRLDVVKGSDYGLIEKLVKQSLIETKQIISTR